MLSPLLALVLAALPVSPEVLAKLETGKVVVRVTTPDDDDGFAARALGIVDAPPARVWPHLRDCSQYKNFMPRAKKSEVREGTPDKGVCFLEISLPFPFSNLWAETDTYTETLPEGGFRRNWKLRKGTYSKNRGSWTVLPTADGQKSLVIYDLEASPDTSLPDSILRSAQSDTLPDVFDAIRKRVAQ